MLQDLYLMRDPTKPYFSPDCPSIREWPIADANMNVVTTDLICSFCTKGKC